MSTGMAAAAATLSPMRKALEKTPFPHPLWPSHYANIASMRAACDAPVDSMGCERCADAGADEHTKRFQTLVSLMLSSQTKDEVTFATTKRLIAAGLGTATAMAAAEEATIAQVLLGPPAVGFWRNKARFLKGAAAMILSDFGGDIPSTVADLVKLPGVGPKMAHITMSAAHGQTVGIGVDTHVHRIANRLGWVKTDTPEATRMALEAFLPRPLWAEVNILLVGFGQQTCQPLRPSCATCLNRDICPTGTGARPLSTPASPARGGAGSASRGASGSAARRGSSSSAVGSPRRSSSLAAAAAGAGGSWDADAAAVSVPAASDSSAAGAMLSVEGLSDMAAAGGAGAGAIEKAPAASDAVRSLGGVTDW